MDLDETGKVGTRGESLFCHQTANKAEQMNVTFGGGGVEGHVA